MNTLRARLILPAISTCILAGLSTDVAPAVAQPSWAPAATATIHPGVMTYT